jgi:hypothetical protein
MTTKLEQEVKTIWGGYQLGTEWQHLVECRVLDLIRSKVAGEREGCYQVCAEYARSVMGNDAMVLAAGKCGMMILARDEEGQ